VSAVILIGAGSAARALSAIGIRTAVHNCQNADLASQVRIEACSEAIHTNLASQGVLARLYFHRAAAYEAANDFDHALQDYNKALELTPDFAEAKADRARLLEQHPANTAK
jgi:tetratricopeptide (TPR) repeat protein